MGTPERQPMTDVEIREGLMRAAKNCGAIGEDATWEQFVAMHREAIKQILEENNDKGKHE